MKKLFLLAVAALACLSQPLSAYVLEGPSWGVSAFTVYLNLTASQSKLGNNLAKFPLKDGTASYNQVYANSAAVWNYYLKNLQIRTVSGTNAQGVTMSNGLNEVGFGTSILGYSLGQYTLATTVWYATSATPSRIVQTSTVVSTAWAWDSYRGNLLNSPLDLERVLLHETGHMIGLDHPDQHGQTVTAIMNSTISNVYTLAPDDVEGGQYLYGVRSH